MQCRVHRIEAVNCAELGSQDIGHFIAVIAFKADAAALHAEMGMCIDKTGVDMFSLSVDNRCSIARQIFTDRGDLPVLDQDISLIGLLMNCVKNQTIFYDFVHYDDILSL